VAYPEDRLASNSVFDAKPTVHCPRLKLQIDSEWKIEGSKDT